MKVTIELRGIESIQRNIDALERAINGKPLSNDSLSLIDTKGILVGIKEQVFQHHEKTVTR